MSLSDPVRSGHQPAPHLVVRSQRVDEVAAQLMDHLPPEGGLAWVRRGDGHVGWGVAARLDVAGGNRFQEAVSWWQELTAAAVIRDEVGVPGSGLVCFGSFGFTDQDPSRAGRPRGDRRPPRRHHLGDHDLAGELDRRTARARHARAVPGVRRRVRRRRPVRHRLVEHRRRRGPADHRRRARQGGARPRPDRDRRAADRPALAAAPARLGVPELLDVLRRRADRRHPGTAGPAGEGPDHVPRAGRDHPPYRRRRARPGAGRVAGPIEQGPGGARVRRPLGRRRAEAALQVDERARDAVRAAPAERDASGHRRRRRRRNGASALGLAAALHPSAAICGTPTDVARDADR